MKRSYHPNWATVQITHELSRSEKSIPAIMKILELGWCQRHAKSNVQLVSGIAELCMVLHAGSDRSKMAGELVLSASHEQEECILPDA